MSLLLVLIMVPIMKYMLICAFILPMVFGDTPANCTYDSIVGSWQFSIGESGYDNTVNCTGFTGPVMEKIKIKLYFPDVAFDNYGHKGFWVLVYNQGFEVVINNRKYFAFSKYVKSGEKNYTSICSQTLPGWSHNVNGKDWACYYGNRTTGEMEHQTIQIKDRQSYDNIAYKCNKDFINQINSAQKSWTATVYDEYATMTIGDLMRKAGGNKQTLRPPKPAAVTAEDASLAANLPSEFDWRNVDGVNFVTPVRDQASCGSCFIFATAGMYEARLKILTGNTVNVTISPQDVVQCSNYSQGCSGGFPYLVGKYSEDFGFVEESCLPYVGKDGPCVEKAGCKRHYATGYRYVGDFYGGCNEALMQIELVKNGPMAVAFEVYDDFMAYKSGIYHHTGLKNKFNPFENTNHAVLLVGYGFDKANGEKFWNVKNSWGTVWGEEGYFRIRRGADECAIESIAVEATPIP